MGKQAMYRDAIWQGKTEYWYLEAYVDDVDIEVGKPFIDDDGTPQGQFSYTAEGLVRIIPPKNWSWPTPLIKWSHSGVGSDHSWPPTPDKPEWVENDREDEKYMIVDPSGRSSQFKPRGWLEAWLDGGETRPPGIETGSVYLLKKGQQIAKVKIGATPVLTLEDAGNGYGVGQLVWRFDRAGKALNSEIPALMWERDSRDSPVEVEFSGRLSKRPNSKLVKFIQEQVTKNLR
jgi:hypothetical protein